MTKPLDRALVWLRRDLRVDDHAALYHALRAARQVHLGFVFDRAILDPLPRADRRVEFIRDSLQGVDAQLRALAASHGIEGCGLVVRDGDASAELPRLAQQLGVQAVFVNHDDEPAALQRDAAVRGALAELGIALHASKDQALFERSELLSGSGTPYTVFTPYRRAWLARLQADDGYYLHAYPVARHADALAPLPHGETSGVPSLAALGFERTNLHELRLPSGPAGAQELLADFLQRIDHYADWRDFPAAKGPSYLGAHLRFGTLSVRHAAREAAARMGTAREAAARMGMAREAAAHLGTAREAAAPAGAAGAATALVSKGAATWLAQLCWRDFFFQVLHHHPQVVTQPFRPGFDRIRWEHGAVAEARFAAWCAGRTGYPLVDAAMRQINQSGYMHNRLRMVAASFLVKHLGIDWRRGEAFFALHLNDFELASNNGNWQWVAGCGCDAQPWLRIFNPVLQSRRFDADGRFIRRYLPELAALPDELLHAPWLARPVDLAAAGIELGRDYPLPIVDHDDARAATLARYAVVRDGAATKAARRPRGAR